MIWEIYLRIENMGSFLISIRQISVGKIGEKVPSFSIKRWPKSCPNEKSYLNMMDNYD